MADESCVVEPVAPLALCCQQNATTCLDEVESNTAGLWHFQNVCRGQYFGTVVGSATCGPNGTCGPE